MGCKCVSGGITTSVARSTSGLKVHHTYGDSKIWAASPLGVFFCCCDGVLCSQWCDRRALAVGTTSLMMMVMLRLLSLSCCCFNRKKQTTLIPTSVVGFEFGVFGLHKSICGVVWGVCCFILLNGNGGVEGILVWMGCFVWFLWCGEEMSKKCKVKMSNMCNKNK